MRDIIIICTWVVVLLGLLFGFSALLSKAYKRCDEATKDYNETFDRFRRRSRKAKRKSVIDFTDGPVQ